LEGNDRSLLEVLSEILPGRTEENHEKVSPDSRCPDRDSNGSPTKYKSIALLLYKPDRFYVSKELYKLHRSQKSSKRELITVLFKVFEGSGSGLFSKD
jgi:hypothetical protein